MFIDRLDVKIGEFTLIVLPSRANGFFHYVNSEDEIECEFMHQFCSSLPDAVINHVNSEIARAYNDIAQNW